jgi:menaquinone-specific isochorismate synthase
VSGSPGDLVAVRLPLGPGPPIDPFALAGPAGILFHSGGRALVGLGTALTIDLPHGLDSDSEVQRAAEVLASIPCDDRFDPATGGVIGFGTLPFERSAPAALVIPEVTYGSDDTGREWVTVVVTTGSTLPSTPADLRSWLASGAPATGHGRERGHSGSTAHGPDPVEPGTLPSRVDPRTSDRSFLAMVADALVAIDRGELVKVVLARHVDVTMGHAIDVPGLLRRWHGLEPNCAIFSLPTPDGQFVGASPELLVERCDRRIRSRPLAGTAERFIGAEGSVLPGELLESRKDATEHRLVVEAIAKSLGTLCSDLEIPSRPDLVHLHNIIHLGTSVSGTLAARPDGTVPTALQLVGALHPTPAVGGVPTGPARALISRLEPESRGHYAGPVGYVDARGNGQWMVGIRAMTLGHHTARLTAGVGIVDGSEPATELVEANLKLTAVLDALAPGLPSAASERTEHRTGVT